MEVATHHTSLLHLISHSAPIPCRFKDRVSMDAPNALHHEGDTGTARERTGDDA